MRLGFALTVLLMLAGFDPSAAQDAVDCDGCKDMPLLARYPGSFLVGAETKAFDEVTVPAGAAVETPDFQQSFPQKQTLEGRVTKLFYHGPQGRSGLEVFANYQEALAGAGFHTLFSCKDDDCGKNFVLGLTDMDPLPGSSITALQGIPDAERPRYLLASLERPEGDVTLALLAADLTQRGNAGLVATVVEAKPMQTGLVTIDADAMEKAMAETGKVALYGIYFDVDKSVLKPESTAQLDQIADLLKAEPDLMLYVTGHTDSTGSFQHNMKLSAARAASVVAALVKGYGIPAARLTAAGLGPTSPVASNETDAGRAKNRRVELVPK